MGLTNADLDKIRNIITSTFSDQFLQELADKVGKIISEKYETKINALEKKLNNIEKEMCDLRNKNQEMEKIIDNHEQSSRSLNVRIFGVPYQEGENLHNIISDIFKTKLKINVKNSDIKKCHRVYAKNPRVDSDKPPAILVRFCNDESRLAVLKNRKCLKSSGIVIKEDLTKIRLALMSSAMEKFGNKNVWCLYGNIYTKNGGVVRRINDLEDLNV